MPVLPLTAVFDELPDPRRDTPTEEKLPCGFVDFNENRRVRVP